jgi:hypothetical protein
MRKGVVQIIVAIVGALGVVAGAYLGGESKKQIEKRSDDS